MKINNCRLVSPYSMSSSLSNVLFNQLQQLVSHHFQQALSHQFQHWLNHQLQKSFSNPSGVFNSFSYHCDAF